jgi:hypothetical protein
MTGAKRNLRHTKNNSGQILLIAAFIMASLLLSTQLYILEVGKITVESTVDSAGDFVLAVKTGSRHVVIGSLANVSNGGPNNVLTSNLDRWRVVIGNQYRLGKTVLDYTLLETAPYSAGLWINWTANGIGTSSAYVDFVHKLSDQEINVNYPYSINATTTALVESSYRIVGGDTKQVNATITLLTEEGPALAEQVTVYYELSGIWLIPSNYTIMDYGNGTYLASFIVDIPSETVQVSAHVVDQRGIRVQTNATSTQA